MKRDTFEPTYFTHSMLIGQTDMFARIRTSKEDRTRKRFLSNRNLRFGSKETQLLIFERINLTEKYKFNFSKFIYIIDNFALTRNRIVGISD